MTDEVSSIKCIRFFSIAILFYLWGKANKKPSPRGEGAELVEADEV